MKLIGHNTQIRVPGIAELFEYYMAKSQKALINIAFDRDTKNELHIEIVEGTEQPCCQNEETGHDSQHDTHHESRAVEPPRSSGSKNRANQ